ncbi:hypothetical protein LTR97_009964 [Elasticomyces elasticus]|uniref:Uncharacterized protein n=1 Tax=Elasticomyces elasticus TaxID=574655 RepID=A0AAN7ZLM4_9PEZI|nr:hypothetical protein LTR97_009964 [Elasticomyces elasticus]KAK5720193.1 hypothetical protein LTR15_007466 [Elasticomyces elasticus]
MEPKHIATKPHLLTLAQELQDKIFSFAYPNTKILGRKQWDDLEWQRYCAAKWGTFRTPRRFQHNIVNDLMVSKQYFVSAGYTYVSKLVFELVADVPADPGTVVRFASSELRKINMTCDIDYGLYKLSLGTGPFPYDSFASLFIRASTVLYVILEFETKAAGPHSLPGRTKNTLNCIHEWIERLSPLQEQEDDDALSEMRIERRAHTRLLKPPKGLWLLVIGLAWWYWLR